jgi:hypothetical protein
MIENCLIDDIPDTFTLSEIVSMSEDKLAELAAEPEETQSLRQTLKQEVEALSKSLVLFRRYKPRVSFIHVS